MIRDKRFLAVSAIALLAIVLFVIAAFGSSDRGIRPGEVAVVDGTPIMLRQYTQVAEEVRSELAPRSAEVETLKPPDFGRCIASKQSAEPGRKNQPTTDLNLACKREFAFINEQVMSVLIQGAWYEKAAAERHMSVSGDEVEHAFETDKKTHFKSQAKFAAFLSQTGQTEADVKALVRIQLLEEKMNAAAAESVVVNDAEVQAEYLRHRAQYNAPETRDLKIVFTADRQKASAAKALATTRVPWSTIVKRFGGGVDPDANGFIKGATLQQYPHKLSQRIFAADKSVVVGPVATRGGRYAIFEISRINPKRQRTLKEAAPAIKRSLALIRAKQAVAQLRSQLRTRWLKKTQCELARATELCENNDEALASR